MKCQVYLLAADDGELNRQQYAAHHYARNRGWHIPGSEDHAAVASRPGEHLPELLPTMSAGDVLLIANVQSLAERPSAQERIVRQLIGRGIRIHSFELGGDLNQHLPGLFAAWASAACVEQELDTALADLDQAEARHKSDLTDFEEDVTRRILADGVSITVGKAPNGNGAANTDLGDAIKTARIKRNLSQRQLAERCDISHTEVQRIEQLGYGKNIEQVMAALEMAHEAPTPEAL
jgi:DNA-binding XRE family transcriptional regulator